MVKAVFLDRDGVIVKNVERDGKACAPRTMSEFEILPGVNEAIHTLAHYGYLIVVITNQPDIGDGLLKQSVLDKMNKKLIKELPIAGIYTCPHSKNDPCLCRKPKPRMLEWGMFEFCIDMKQSWMIGDRMSDIDAGRAAGCFDTVLITDEHKENAIVYDLKLAPNLREAVKFILEAI